MRNQVAFDLHLHHLILTWYCLSTEATSSRLTDVYLDIPPLLTGNHVFVDDCTSIQLHELMHTAVPDFYRAIVNTASDIIARRVKYRSIDRPTI